MACLELEGLTKVFPGGIVAVRDLCLSVAEGEFLVLLGPSGCGKTTTLRLVAGLERPTSGGVRLAGRDALRLRPNQRDVAMVFARGALYPHWSVYQNLACGARLRQRSGWWRLLAGAAGNADGSDDVDTQVRAVAKQLGLTELLKRRPGELSDGQRQRVALGRAMVRRPSVYLMDEPLTGLDAPLRQELRSELREWHKTTGATVLYVTHDQTEALLLGDRIAVMNHGEVQQIGSAGEIYERPRNRFVAGFIGSPPMNFWEGELSRDSGDHWTFSRGDWRLRLAGLTVLRATAEPQAPHTRAVMAVRPEHLSPCDGCGSLEGSVKEAGVADELLRIDGVVRRTESAGDLKLVYLEPPAAGADAAPGSASQTINETLLVRWHGAEVPSIGELIHVTAKKSDLHFFDAVSGLNLALPENG